MVWAHQKIHRWRRLERLCSFLKLEAIRTWLCLIRVLNILIWRTWSLLVGFTLLRQRITSFHLLQQCSTLNCLSRMLTGILMHQLLRLAVSRQAPAHWVFTSWLHKALSGASSTRRLQSSLISQTTTGRTSTRKCRWFSRTSSWASSWFQKVDFGTTTSTDKTSPLTCASTWCWITRRTSTMSLIGPFISWTLPWELRPMMKTLLLTRLTAISKFLEVALLRIAICQIVTITSSEQSVANKKQTLIKQKILSVNFK